VGHLAVFLSQFAQNMPKLLPHNYFMYPGDCLQGMLHINTFLSPLYAREFS